MPPQPIIVGDIGAGLLLCIPTLHAGAVGQQGSCTRAPEGELNPPMLVHNQVVVELH